MFYELRSSFAQLQRKQGALTQQRGICAKKTPVQMRALPFISCVTWESYLTTLSFGCLTCEIR